MSGLGYNYYTQSVQSITRKIMIDKDNTLSLSVSWYYSLTDNESITPYDAVAVRIDITDTIVVRDAISIVRELRPTILTNRFSARRVAQLDIITSRHHNTHSRFSSVLGFLRRVFRVLSSFLSARQSLSPSLSVSLSLGFSLRCLVYRLTAAEFVFGSPFTIIIILADSGNLIVRFAVSRTNNKYGCMSSIL